MRSLRMTPAASDEIFTAFNTEGERTRGGEKGERERAQDDRIKAPSPREAAPFQGGELLNSFPH
jgi:hypothetical protein